MRRRDGLPKRRWSPEDDQRLRRIWGLHSLKQAAKILGRTEATTYWRARQLKLPCGVPQGYEYLTAAAERTGFTTGQLRVVLAFAGVRVSRTISRPPSRARGYHFVDPFDVDTAVDTWLATEPVESGAARRAMCADTLRRLLVGAGHRPPHKKKHWRVASTELDRIVSEWRARRSLLTVSQHAPRVGVSRQTLAKRLRSAGVLGEKRSGGGGLTRLTNEVVDRALEGAA